MKSRASAALGFLWAICGLATAGEYDAAISAAFPGYRIVQPSERDLAEFPGMFPGVRDKPRKAPAVVVGRFNQDQFRDFAAYILDPASKRRTHPPSPGAPEGVHTYTGWLVVCFGQERGQYRCQRPFPHLEVIQLPHNWYLEGIPPGKLDCPGLGRIRPWEPPGSKGYEDYLGKDKTIRISTDALAARQIEGNAGRIMVFQPDGSFLDCSFD